MAPLPARLGPDRHADKRTETPRRSEHLGELPLHRSVGGPGKVRGLSVQHLAWLQREVEALAADDGGAPLHHRRSVWILSAAGYRDLARPRARTCHARDPVARALAGRLWTGA